MSIDVSNLSAAMDYSALLPSNKGVLGDNILNQWSMLRSNSKALKAAIVAEERGYLRDREAPARQSMADKLYNPADRSVTVADVLERLGLKSSIPVEESEAAAQTQTTDTADNGAVDVTA